VCGEFFSFHGGFFEMAKPVSTVFHPHFEGSELMAQDYCGSFINIDETTIQYQHNWHVCKMLKQ
jgi:hypothetical protein